MSGNAIHLYQERAYMNAREIGLTQAKAAFIADISEHTGQRMEAGTHRPNRGTTKPGGSHQDPLAGVWENGPAGAFEQEYTVSLERLIE